MENRVKISKQMAYLLRHNPQGMEISREGFTGLDKLLDRLRERWPDLKESDIRSVVAEDPKGRYEIKGERIRARYGHSIDVQPTLDETDVDTLYHGTTKKASEEILGEGLRPKGRQKVHLSKTVESAVQVGQRRTRNPVILKIDVGKAKEEGIKVERASDEVYVTDYIPPRFISLLDLKTDA